MLDENTKRLRVLMAEHDLKAEDVSALLNRTVSTVYHWRKKGGKVIPQELLELLELKLEKKANSQQGDV